MRPVLKCWLRAVVLSVPEFSGKHAWRCSSLHILHWLCLCSRPFLRLFRGHDLANHSRFCPSQSIDDTGYYDCVQMRARALSGPSQTPLRFLLPRGSDNNKRWHRFRLCSKPIVFQHRNRMHWRDPISRLLYLICFNLLGFYLLCFLS